MNTRVFITGVGVLSSIGNSPAEFHDSLTTGTPGYRRIDQFDTGEYPFDRAALIADHPQAYRQLRAQQPDAETANLYGMHCATEALADAGLAGAELNPFRTAVVVASSNAGVETNQVYMAAQVAGEPDGGETCLRTPGTATAAIRNHLGLRGPQMAVSTACAAGGNSVGIALDMIRNGTADVALAGGVEPFCLLSFSGFTLLKSLTHTELKSFDEYRDGTGLGEAACLFVLESEESMLRRGATPYAEVCGYGISDDAYHATAPDPEGGGAALAIAQCLDDSGLTPDEVDYVNAHGTGTKYNDIMELTALTRVFGDRLPDIPVSSTKSLHGHTLSCAGSLELLVCLLAIKHRFVPGNINLATQLSEFPGVQVPSTPTAHDVDVAISNSFGFAGNNTCIAVRRAA